MLEHGNTALSSKHRRWPVLAGQVLCWLMVALRRPSPRVLLLGSVWLVASCGALGLSASHVEGPKPPAPPAARMARTPSAVSQPRVVSAARPASSDKNACPEDMVLVERTCIDRYEAHLLRREADGSLTPFPPHSRPEGGQFVAASKAATKPQAFISQCEAAEACANAGKRLCRLTEWYRACTGRPRTTYPYGAVFEAKRCNVGKPHLLSLLHGTRARNWSYANFNDPQLATTDGFLARTGEYAGCVSAEGVHDMVGNLHEWVEDRVDRSLPSKLPVPAIIERRIGRNVGNGIFMGGFFSTVREHGEGCTFTTAAHDPRYHDYSTGFRCCQDASE